MMLSAVRSGQFAANRSRCALSSLGTRESIELKCIDCHAAGEPARVVVGGFPVPPGETMYDKRNYMMEHLDNYRKLLITEPRGYPCQNVDYIMPPVDKSAKFGFVIGEQNKIYPAMSGHNTICVATALLESGMVPMEEPITNFSIEAPGGLIDITAQCEDGKATNITLKNVAAFCRASDMDVEIDVPELGKVTLDIAYGGMHYAIVDASSIGLDLRPELGRQLARAGEMIKIAARDQHPVQHPEIDYPGPDILVFRGASFTDDATGALHSKNAVIMSNNELDWDRPETWTGMIDRSPCGTGTCAVMAALHARGELALGQDFVHESIVGTQFVGRLLEETTVGQGSEAVNAVVPTISGQAWITQYSTVVRHVTDPFPEGYTVGDIW